MNVVSTRERFYSSSSIKQEISVKRSCGIQAINEWAERRKSRKEWDEHVTRMDAERLVKISRDNIPAGKRSPGRLRRRWNNLVPS